MMPKNMPISDVVRLLKIASSSEKGAIIDFLTCFCSLNEKIRFASLWKFNNCSHTISIFARSNNADAYKPKLESNNRGIQEFCCSTNIYSVNKITEQFLNSDLKKSLRPKIFDIPINSGNFDLFHPKELPQTLNTKSFYLVPIELPKRLSHNSKIDERIRFFCLLYGKAEYGRNFISEDDISIATNCLGNLIANRLRYKREKSISELTKFLMNHHSSDEPPILNHMRSTSIPCEWSYYFDSDRSTAPIKSEGAPSLSQIEIDHITKKVQDEWSKQDEDCKEISLILTKLKNHVNKTQLRSCLVYSFKDTDSRDNGFYLFCNKTSQCQFFLPTGPSTFPNEFGLDDKIVLNELGAHIRAFTTTKIEEQRRRDTARIVAHEIKQPIIDSMNTTERYWLFQNPILRGRKKFSLTTKKMTDLIFNHMTLANAMIEMNIGLESKNISDILKQSTTATPVESHLHHLKTALRVTCDDMNFKNSNIDVNIDDVCRNLRFPDVILTTYFINLVSNAIKYSKREFGNGWCVFRMQRMYGQQDPKWHQYTNKTNHLHDGVLLTAADNGIGIKKSDLPYIFNKEFRAQDDMRVRGLGLGLHQVRKLTHLLAGEVWAESQLNSGDPMQTNTRVSIILPATKFTGV